MSERSTGSKTWANPLLNPSRPRVINIFVSAVLSVLGCLTICSCSAIVLPPRWAVRRHVDIFVWRVPSERSVNLRYGIDRGCGKTRGRFLYEKKTWRRRRQGGRWLRTPHVWLFVSLGWKLGGRGNALQSRFEIKASSSFIYLFFHQKLHGAAEDHSELASICHEEGPGTLALPCLPPTPTRPAPLLCFHPAPLHWDFSLCTAKLPISTRMITAHSDLYSGESSSTSFGRH